MEWLVNTSPTHESKNYLYLEVAKWLGTFLKLGTTFLGMEKEATWLIKYYGKYYGRSLSLGISLLGLPENAHYQMSVIWSESIPPLTVWPIMHKMLLEFYINI